MQLLSSAVQRLGLIDEFTGLHLVSHGPPQTFIGEVCDILDEHNQVMLKAEVIGFKQEKVYLMPYDSAPIRMGYKVRATGHPLMLKVGQALLGKVVDAFANPIGTQQYAFYAEQVSSQHHKINPLIRQPISQRLSTGIQAIDGLLPIGKGQRVGIFAGSGVGKSTLITSIAQNTASDVNVIALIGERGREVNDFIQSLPQATLKKSILVVACSDESALMRRQAAFTATAIAEFFCAQDKEVLLLMDSISRFAMAQREIGLSLGEPPTARGYTPSVFALLPNLVERAGRFKTGCITALYSVLVEGDDFNEPLADHMRALLDGHIVLTRELAQRGHYPAISIVQSVSRLSKQLLGAEEQHIVQQVISMLSLYQQNKELIEIGAYKAGNHEALDKALKAMPDLEQLLKQSTMPGLIFQELMQGFKEIIQ